MQNEQAYTEEELSAIWKEIMSTEKMIAAFTRYEEDKQKKNKMINTVLGSSPPPPSDIDPLNSGPAIDNYIAIINISTRVLKKISNINRLLSAEDNATPSSGSTTSPQSRSNLKNSRRSGPPMSVGFAENITETTPVKIYPNERAQLEQNLEQRLDQLKSTLIPALAGYSLFSDNEYVGWCNTLKAPKQGAKPNYFILVHLNKWEEIVIEFRTQILLSLYDKDPAKFMQSISADCTDSIVSAFTNKYPDIDLPQLEDSGDALALIGKNHSQKLNDCLNEHSFSQKIARTILQVEKTLAATTDPNGPLPPDPPNPS